MNQTLQRISASDRGATMVEYGLMVALVAILSIATLSMLGHSTEDTFTTVGEALAAGDTSGGDLDPGDDAGESTDPGDDTGGATNPGDDSGTTDPGDDTGGATNPGDDSGTTDPGDGDTSGGDKPTPPAPGSETEVTSTGSDFYWWNGNSRNGNGAWVARFDYQNDWIRHQYLTLEVTRIGEDGDTETLTVRDFYVPAGGSRTYELWDNDLEMKRGDARGVVSVEVRVISVRTSDEAWQPVTYPVDRPPSTVSHPAP